MWKYISLFGVLLATGSHANAYHKRANKLAPAISWDATTHNNHTPQSPSDPEKPDLPDIPHLPSSPFFHANPAEPPKSPQLPGSSHHVEAEPASPPNALSLPTPFSTSPPASPTDIVYHVPHVSRPVPPSWNSTSTPTNSTVRGPENCTGCVIAARRPVTTSFNPKDKKIVWESYVVTATVISEYVTYMDNNTIETVVTERKTVNQTKTVTISDAVIMHHTPTFEVLVTKDVYVTLLAGPTYVIYNDIIGGLDHYNEQRWPEYDWTQKGCDPATTQLRNWQPPKNATIDWSSFIATFTGNPPPQETAMNQAFALPSKAIEYLKKEPAIMSQYHGADIATCSVSRATQSRPFQILPTGGLPMAPQPPLNTGLETPTSMIPILPSPLTNTYLATTYDTTSVHVTVRGCLRCQETSVNELNVPTNRVNVPSQTRINAPQDSVNTPTPVAPGQNAGTATRPTPVPGIPTASMMIGGVLFPINVPRPTWNNNGQSPPPPGIVIGQETFTPGETKTINGVPVNALPDGNGAAIVVGGSTLSLNPVVTPSSPVIAIGGGRVEANPNGDFVFGPVTLKAGGSPIVVNGNTVSLGSNGIAIVNGVTQTISNAPVATPIPAFIAGGQIVSATVVGGSPVFVIAPGQTLGAGGTLVVNGTTYAVPADAQGPVIVINGKTSTLGAGQPVITNGEGQPITAQVTGGVPAYVLAPGQTLTPGGVVTVSGTTYALPADGSGNVVVINAVTSTIANGAGMTAAPALIINGVTYTNKVRDGTTEYILGNGTTLAQGGAVVIDGTTYSLDKAGTALVINGQTSTISNLPKSTSATTTGSSSSSNSPTTTHNAGDLIASGIGETSKQRGAASYGTGIDKWVENMVICAAGWLFMLL
ncbi:hypothetical protein PtrCC142_001809 [Pyrenophora tritici-repentis]|nr:hypothetical protein PtrSN001C_001504 [Pyrenophora tritici-repentis]KAI1576481.1 hypothetical protein PtrEW4_002077 [Pyrenophora tritici-repentis]KAI1606051.1 hypothetical protein PtrCC142_001809 [Pyrenophora tritici-repentis]